MALKVRNGGTCRQRVKVGNKGIKGIKGTAEILSGMGPGGRLSSKLRRAEIGSHRKALPNPINRKVVIKTCSTSGLHWICILVRRMSVLDGSGPVRLSCKPTSSTF